MEKIFRTNDTNLKKLVTMGVSHIHISANKYPLLNIVTANIPVRRDAGRRDAGRL